MHVFKIVDRAQKRILDFLQSAITDSFQIFHAGAGVQIPVFMIEQQVFLAAEPSLQPHVRELSTA